MQGDICAICCGTEREQTVHCPLDCEYLQEARKREQPAVADPDAFPNRDVRVSEKFLREQEPLLVLLSVALLRAAMEIPNVVDADVKGALEGLIRTYRSLESGLYYESRPENTIAAGVFSAIQDAVAEYRQSVLKRSGLQTVRDADVLGILVFLQRMEIQQDNGRRLGRAFIDFLRVHFPEVLKPAAAASPLIV